jgi:hypothetical protein
MTLIDFPSKAHGTVHINPENVTAIYVVNENETRIRFDHENIVTISMPIQDVIRKISQKS